MRPFVRRPSPLARGFAAVGELRRHLGSTAPTRRRPPPPGPPWCPWLDESPEDQAPRHSSEGGGPRRDPEDERPPLRHRTSSPRWVTAYIGLGSNVGDRVGEIERACLEMKNCDINVRRTSSLWETDPMYVVDQGRFLNGVCEVQTNMSPLVLLDKLQGIEKSMGRRKVVDKGPRNIDLDILLYGERPFCHRRLQVPHARIAEREFVLRPLAQLIPNKLVDRTKPVGTVRYCLDQIPPGNTMSYTPLGRSASPLTAMAPNRKTQVMAILNLTPDSFSDGGRHTLANLSTAVVDMIRGGATVIDVGGQSTAPGRPPVTPEEEAARVVPAIKLIRSLPEARGVVISVDTYRASLAEKAVDNGADVVNDVSAGAMDPLMLPTVARLGVTICLSHMRGTPQTMMEKTKYPGGLVPKMASELRSRVAAAQKAGIARWRIVLDPGIGFAKTGPQNLELLRGLGDLRRCEGLEGLPWLVGPSRKAFVATATGAADMSERVWGTASAVAAAIQGGADMVRVHDAREMAMVAAMSDAIWRDP